MTSARLRAVAGASAMVLALAAPSALRAQVDSVAPSRLGLDGVADVADTGRPRAFEYSDAYGKRLAIHRIASYAELPLFGAEYVVGEKLLNDERTSTERPGAIKQWHGLLAGGLGVLFAVNTYTGVANLWEARHDPNGRLKRSLHGLSMLAADAGFVWAATLAQSARRSDAGATRHRTVAVASMSLATASTLMMWFWKR